MSLMGIDIGTTGCKAAAFSDDGRCISAAYREYPTVRSKIGWAQLDSHAVMRAVKEVIAEAAAKTANDPVQAISVSSLGEAMTPVSADGEILDDSILGADVRGGDLLKRITAAIGQKEYYKINPNILGSNYSLPKLLWLKHNKPDLYQKTDKFLLWGDLVTFILSGESMTSFSLANRTLLFDIHRETWSDELLKLCDIERAKLPMVVASGTIAGSLRASITAELNLSKNIKVVVGAHDQCCNSLGAGIYTAGKAVCGIGTFECITPTYDHLPDSEYMLANGLNIEHHVLAGLYVSFIYNQSGSLVRWFRDTFASADKKLIKPDEDIYEVLAGEMPAEPARLLTLPYFEASGAPHFITDAAGVIAGLKINTQRGEILKSIMECATFYFLESIDSLKKIGIDTSEFVVTGGGAKSNQWLQIKADIFGVPFVRPKIVECSVLGAAMLAGISIGVFADAQDAVSQCVKIDSIFEPDAKRHKIYQEKYAIYKRLFPVLWKASTILEES
ncbi:MAG: FGGY-family carbohydrate kinase [Sedimentisphaerales bacterium]